MLTGTERKLLEQAAEIDRLRAELAGYRDAYHALANNYGATISEYEEMCEEIDTLKAHLADVIALCDEVAGLDHVRPVRAWVHLVRTAATGGQS